MPYRAALSALALALTAVTSLGAQGAAMRVAPSGRATTEVELTLSDSVARAATTPSRIRIDYGQPHLRGRTLLTEGLVPYDKSWRLGANSATTLTTDVDLAIGGQRVPKGSYVLQALPGRGGWTLLVQRTGTPPAAPDSPPANVATEIARIDLRQSTLASPLESLTMWLIPSRDAGAPHGELRIAWGTIALVTEWALR